MRQVDEALRKAYERHPFRIVPGLMIYTGPETNYRAVNLDTGEEDYISDELMAALRAREKEDMRGLWAEYIEPTKSIRVPLPWDE